MCEGLDREDDELQMTSRQGKLVAQSHAHHRHEVGGVEDYIIG
jgi:hypothetical protein